MSKSWQEKFDQRSDPQVKTLRKAFAGIQAGEDMLIATPAIISAYLRKIPAGRSVTVSQMRDDLARKFQADKTCPVTTGIFLRIVAEKSYEELQQGKPLKEIAPFWRALDPDVSLRKKLGFDPEFIDRMRGAENHDAASYDQENYDTLKETI